ncbi:hypothetical protein RHMOL_Rhmol07G0085100 [Rhododendron molle]|uniref:Uncharacterized protein n=1 Tax=Rhododendron molle TaxID=49168 RepID=A0ACC0N0H3_RHOML|nr:hypothetical protein RHMOL_Rhmol07G0085100 [Rhododendron molle]
MRAECLCFMAGVQQKYDHRLFQCIRCRLQTPISTMMMMMLYVCLLKQLKIRLALGCHCLYYIRKGAGKAVWTVTKIMETDYLGNDEEVISKIMEGVGDMKILSWNVRGLGMKENRNEVKKMAKMQMVVAGQSANIVGMLSLRCDVFS